ncbi:MAG TPA: DUF72 domain-containing protein [Bryobacteraceae bacterium]|nr:DUF72 domain-containing protein [Bryobacteraceae bacterium]
MSGDAKLHIGTSGWHYKHWRGPFYPEKLPASKMLDFYTQYFDTVELNNTFYRLPQPNGLENWRESTPRSFHFAMKGSRFLTHMKKLKDAELGVERFFERADLLGRKLGPVVFQLPPHWRVDAQRLEEFLRVLPRHHRYAFELRDPSWHTSEIYTLLRRHRAAFCIFEIAGLRSGFEVTTDFTYVRLHGPEGAYQGSYSTSALDEWARRIGAWSRELRAIYIYFDNDQAGYAPKNALELLRMTS